MEALEILNSIPELSEWLKSHRQSPAFACDDARAGCTPCHVMAPLLHGLGAFRGYETYASVIQRVVADLVGALSRVRILVAGVDSEHSALAVMRTVAIFEDLVQVVFADRCQTPLRRIEQRIKPHYSCETIEIDILDTTDSRLLRSCDLVLADSFIRQFAGDRKVAALQRLAAAICDHRSRIIVHEYVGRTDDLLRAFWARMTSARNPLLSAADRRVMATDEFRRMLSELDHYYRENGAMYGSPCELRNDLAVAGMNVVDEFVKPGAPDQLVIAAPTASTDSPTIPVRAGSSSLRWRV